jgi:murein DD-endopeptidase MepM/ murein hydrolase activator NlpD
MEHVNKLWKTSLTFTLFLLLALGANNSWSAELPRQSAVPGGITHILLQGGADRPQAKFRGHHVMILPTLETRYESQAPWVAIVGIPLSVSEGRHFLELGAEKIPFEVAAKAYREQRLTIKEKRKVNPNPDDLKRIKRESKEILAGLASWTPVEQPFTRLLKPTRGPFSSPFGLKRFFNEQPRKPHSGLDIAAPQGTPIIAPAPGRVVATGNYFFNGNTVILDHGQGLTSLYCHMQGINVKLGDRLEAGQQLGSVGMTGRVTGPHLHWGVSLNNARIDPTLLMDSSIAEPTTRKAAPVENKE